MKFKDLRDLRVHFLEDNWACRDELISYAWRGTEKFRSRIKPLHGKMNIYGLVLDSIEDSSG